MASATFVPGTPLDFTEAIKDSPQFRSKISMNERYFDKVQKRLDEVRF